jgi:hypothetical protein
MPLSHSFYFHARCLSFSVRLASRLAISLGKATPHRSLHTPPRPYNMSAAGVKKGRKQHNQAETSPSELSQGLLTPSLMGTGPELECRFTLRARIIRTRVSTSASANSIEKKWLGQLSPGYLHIVTSRHRSGWTQRLMKVQRRSAPVKPSRSKLWRMSRTGCSWWVSFLATLYPQLGWTVGRLPVTTRSGALTSFLRKNYSFRHPTDGFETERWKYGSTPGPVRT